MFIELFGRFYAAEDDLQQSEFRCQQKTVKILNNIILLAPSLIKKIYKN